MRKLLGIVLLVPLSVAHLLASINLYSKLSFANKCGELNNIVKAEYNFRDTPSCVVNGFEIDNLEELDHLTRYHRRKKTKAARKLLEDLK
jgi:hypothetical protein